MKLHFITSISKEYWFDTAKKCISTWNLPGDVTIFIDQQYGDLDWIKEIPYHTHLLSVPPLKVDEFTNTAKVRKFWGKTCSQIIAVRNRDENERVIWIDGDVEQIGEVPRELFDFNFEEPLAMLNSNNNQDCWETGIVIFNQQYGKLNQVMKRYENAWQDEEILTSLWKPYDAQVLGYVANDRGFKNLCNESCKNADALKHSALGAYFIHWINKTNKAKLNEQD